MLSGGLRHGFLDGAVGPVSADSAACSLCCSTRSRFDFPGLSASEPHHTKTSCTKASSEFSTGTSTESLPTDTELISGMDVNPDRPAHSIRRKNGQHLSEPELLSWLSCYTRGQGMPPKYITAVHVPRIRRRFSEHRIEDDDVKSTSDDQLSSYRSALHQ
jgi:hypothetical protein